MSETCKIISVLNRKGGVGKTTTVFNLGVALANGKSKKSVLLIDLDPQSSLTISMGFTDLNSFDMSVSSVFSSYLDADDPYNFQPDLENIHFLRHPEKVSLLPSDKTLASVEYRLAAISGGSGFMKDFLAYVSDRFDYIIFDCSPNLGVLANNALMASDSVIIPSQAAFLSNKGVKDLIQYINGIKHTGNNNIKISGILLTMYNDNTNYSVKQGNEIYEYCSKLGINVFTTKIPFSIKAPECTSMGKSIFTHNPSGKVAEAYRLFAEEVSND